MEYVSVLSGARFSDRPRCTHPLLGRMARLVNDTVDDDDRAGLRRLIGFRQPLEVDPDLAHAGGAGRRGPFHEELPDLGDHVAV
jgi:hypothetical protein